MVTTEQLYYEVKLATGDISTDIDLEKANFVLLYNREAMKWLSEKIELTKRDSRINEAQHWLMSDVSLKESGKTDKYIAYDLPEDFLSFAGSTSLAQKNKCQRVLVNYLVKPLNKELLYHDVFERPSFEWEESSCVLSGDKLLVYYTDYNLVKSYISYYKKMEEIDIEGYSKFGTSSKTINPTYNRQIANEITERVVKEVNKIYRNQLGFQLSSQTVQTDQLT